MSASFVRGSPAGNSQVERMIQHFHHGERISDFVGHFGGEEPEGGELFVLPQLLFHIHDSLVEPGFFDGDGGQFRQRGENPDFLV